MAFQYYLDAFRNFATFEGRARRSEYWYFLLFNFIVLATLLILGSLINDSLGLILYIGYVLVSFVPNLALSVRRLHDVGKSGWFLFIALIPLIGGIWLIVLNCTDSDPGENEYGPNPKGIGNTDENQIEEIGQ